MPQRRLEFAVVEDTCYCCGVGCACICITPECVTHDLCVEQHGQAGCLEELAAAIASMIGNKFCGSPEEL